MAMPTGVSTKVSATADHHTWSWLSSLIRVTIGAAIFVAVLWPIDARELAARCHLMRPGIAVALCLIAFTKRVLMAYKWNLLLRARGVFISVWQAIYLYFVGHLLGALTPGGIGADAYRVVALSSLKKTHTIVSTVLLERFIGLTIMGTLAALTLPLSVQYLGVASTSAVWSIILGTAAAAMVLLILLRPSIAVSLIQQIPCFSRTIIAAKIYNFSVTYTKNRPQLQTLLLFTTLTILEAVASIYVNYLAARAINIDVSFGYFLSVMPLVQILSRLPISFQGFGITEGLFVYFLVVKGYSASDGVAVALLLRAAELFYAFLPASLMLWLGALRLRLLPGSL